MDKKTLIALKECIKKYERYVRIVKESKEKIHFANNRSYGLHFGVDKCALCEIHHTPEFCKPEFCKYCPIKQKVNEYSCNNIPYDEIMKALDYNKRGNEELLIALQTEVDFLKYLLPEEVVNGVGY